MNDSRMQRCVHARDRVRMGMRRCCTQQREMRQVGRLTFNNAERILEYGDPSPSLYSGYQSLHATGLGLWAMPVTVGQAWQCQARTTTLVRSSARLRRPHGTEE